MGDAAVRLGAFFVSLIVGGVLGVISAIITAKVYQYFCNTRGYVEEGKYIWAGFLIAIIVALLPQAYDWMFGGQPEQIVFDAVSYARTHSEMVDTLQVDFYGKVIGCAVTYFGFRHIFAGRVL